jgi:hypothetical protein
VTFELPRGLERGQQLKTLARCRVNSDWIFTQTVELNPGMNLIDMRLKTESGRNCQLYTFMINRGWLLRTKEKFELFFIHKFIYLFIWLFFSIGTICDVSEKRSLRIYQFVVPVVSHVFGNAEARLEALSLDVKSSKSLLEPAFDPDWPYYSAWVQQEVDTVTISAKSMYDRALITINQCGWYSGAESPSFPLLPGKNVI